MKTKAFTAAALITCFAALSPAMAQTASPQGGTGGGNATSNLPKDGGQNTMSGTGSAGKTSRAGKTGMTGKNNAKGSPVVNEKSSSTDANSTATQGGGASPLTTGEGMKQSGGTAR
ncbi:hypothetical protein GN316_07505 [Xylophilus sp. Kf1]|nr:hypothetical protein [Xylophilus sp. Kf1]